MGLSYTFGSQFLQCTQSSMPFNQTLQLECLISREGSADFYV